MLNAKLMFYVKQFLSNVCVLGLLLAGEAPMAHAANPLPENNKEATHIKAPIVVMYTNKGVVKIELDPQTPITTQNFLTYVKSGAYNGTIFHRVIDGFMIQGGGFTRDMQEKPTKAPIENEGKLCGQNVRGSIAMARTSDPDSATDQFFINVVDNHSFLDYKSDTMQGWGYCAFGHVVAGMEVVDKIKSVSTTTRDGFENVPVEPVIIERIEVQQA